MRDASTSYRLYVRLTRRPGSMRPEKQTAYSGTRGMQATASRGQKCSDDGHDLEAGATTREKSFKISSFHPQAPHSSTPRRSSALHQPLSSNPTTFRTLALFSTTTPLGGTRAVRARAAAGLARSGSRLAQRQIRADDVVLPFRTICCAVVVALRLAIGLVARHISVALAKALGGA